MSCASKELVDRFEQLEQEARRAEHKGKYIGKVRHMLSYVPEFEGLGDFDGLIRRLKQLAANGPIKEALPFL